MRALSGVLVLLLLPTGLMAQRPTGLPPGTQVLCVTSASSDQEAPLRVETTGGAWVMFSSAVSERDGSGVVHTPALLAVSPHEVSRIEIRSVLRSADFYIRDCTPEPERRRDSRWLPLHPVSGFSAVRQPSTSPHLIAHMGRSREP